MKHCCKNVVILMPEPVAEPALNGLRLNLRIVSIVMFNFASYLTIGLPLAVLPGYVHDVMGFSAFWAGLVISLQYFATLLSRPHAGRYADLLGPKKIVVFGLCGCFLSGLGYLTAGLTASLPVISLLLLCLGRVILGIGQSFAGTGSTLWGVGVVGSLHIGRVISWNGIVTYGAMASVLLLVMTVVFMLFEVRHVPYKMRFALNNPQIHIAGLHRALKGVSHYLALKTLLSLWTGVIVWLGLALMGVQFALMWAVLAFLLNYVPNIGAVISAVPPMIQVLLFNGVYECILVGALFLVVHMVIGNILEPRMMGHRLGMSTMVVFLSLLIWGWLLGPVGMLLSVPLTSVCKIWMETTKGGSKLAILLGPGRPKSRLPG
ncbi:AI-2E family transporter [Escherichia coli]|uniref:AI-2E family transporter n=1 Tax=Escherichia coli TaxID=562 RepID=UPI003984D6F5